MGLSVAVVVAFAAFAVSPLLAYQTISPTRNPTPTIAPTIAPADEESPCELEEPVDGFVGFGFMPTGSVMLTLLIS